MSAKVLNWLLVLLGLCRTAAAVENLSALVADRAAVERVYYEHRLGAKPPFEQTLGTAQLEALVKADLHKEATLKRVYGVEVTDATVAAEVNRIDASTRAPETLAELKRALGDDPARFARTVARPIVVERLLREKFESDDRLHVAQRETVERVRSQLLVAKQQDQALEALLALLKASKAGTVADTTWKLGPRPADNDSTRPSSIEATTNSAHAGLYSVEATAQVAQVLSSPASPDAHGQPESYLEDLPPELQRVLRVQLRQPRDISAVIEMPRGFLLCVLQSRTSAAMTAGTLFLPKRPLEEWLAEQTPDYNHPDQSAKAP